MTILPIPKKDEIDDFSDLFEDVKRASDHELHLAVGAVKPPKLPWRSVHPIADRFDGMDTAEYRRLVEDIRQNGQRKAICMYQGMIWDGRARYDACVELSLVPRVFALRRGDPIIYLLQRHGARYGRPQTPERSAAVAILDEILGSTWQEQEKAQRVEWIGAARAEFLRQYRHPEPCAVCGMDRDYSHAHHSLPLSLQYELGVDEAIQEHDWLCHVHHRLVHALISQRLLGIRSSRPADYDYRYKDALSRDRARKALDAAFQKVARLYAEVGGVAVPGNWGTLAP